MSSPAYPIRSSYFTDTCWWSKVSGVAAYSLEINQSLLRCQTNAGNDVASGLKWMLASNSVVLMPLPRRESWAMESLLQVYVFHMVRGMMSSTVSLLTLSSFSTALGALYPHPFRFFGPAR